MSKEEGGVLLPFSLETSAQSVFVSPLSADVTDESHQLFHSQVGVPKILLYGSPSGSTSETGNGNSIIRYVSGPYTVSGVSGNKGMPLFNVILATISIIWGPQSVTPTYINESSEMEIVQAAVKNEIINVNYDINGAKVLEAAPLIALSTSVRNDSDGDATQTLTYEYEKWEVGTWNNTAGVEIGSKATFSAGVPFIASTEFEISITTSYSHEWGGEVGVRMTVISSTAVTVPPKKKGRARMFVRNAQLDVPITYTQRILWSNGTSEYSKQTGIYNNVDSWHVDTVVLDNWQDV